MPYRDWLEDFLKYECQDVLETNQRLRKYIDSYDSWWTAISSCQQRLVDGLNELQDSEVTFSPPDDKWQYEGWLHITLSARSICGFGLPPRVTERLRNANVSLLDLSVYLERREIDRLSNQANDIVSRMRDLSPNPNPILKPVNPAVYRNAMTSVANLVSKRDRLVSEFKSHVFNLYNKGRMELKIWSNRYVNHVDYEQLTRQLPKIIKTDNEYTLVKRAYWRFAEAIAKSYRCGRSPSDRIVWVVPHDYTTNPQQTIYDEIRDVGEVQSLQRSCSEWLPWLPFAVIQHLRAWRQPTFRLLYLAMRKLALRIERRANAYYPWEPLDSKTRYIPIQSLYQYEPSTYDTIRTLENCGLTSINDLRCVHPDAVAAAKHGATPLFRIYQSLNARSSQ